MKTITVETTGDFMLLDVSSGASIEASGASTVPDTQFVRDRIELGQLREVEVEPKKAAKPKAE